MRLDRLKYLARQVLPFVPSHKLDMGVWRCDTAACAFGWMCISPRGRHDGLVLAKHRSPQYKGYFELEAAMEYFGVDPETALWLFSDGYEGGLEFCNGEHGRSLPDEPSSVAARIELLIAMHEGSKQ